MRPRVWERWDAIKPDGSIHDGRMTPFEGAGDPAERGDEHEPHMLSFNHYAYGAVIDWVYRNVGGVAPDVDAPGLSPSGARSSPLRRRQRRIDHDLHRPRCRGIRVATRG